MNASDWRGTLSADTPAVQITRLMPGFHVSFRGRIRQSVPVDDRDFDCSYWTEAVRKVRALMVIAREYPH